MNGSREAGRRWAICATPQIDGDVRTVGITPIKPRTYLQDNFDETCTFFWAPGRLRRQSRQVLPLLLHAQPAGGRDETLKPIRTEHDNYLMRRGNSRRCSADS